MKNELALFTFKFPYGAQETFLENEIPFLRECFGRITIIPLFEDKSIRVSDGVELLPAVFKNKRRKFLRNCLTISFWLILSKALKEVRFSYRGLKKSLKQALIINELKKYLSLNKGLFQKKCWYFYWGTNSVNVLPFLESHPKCVARFHRFDLYDLDIDGGEVQVFRKEMLTSLDAILPVSEDGLNYLAKKFPRERSKIQVSRLGVEDKGFSHSSEDQTLRIVTCSNIISVKRVELLANALKHIKDFQVVWTHFGSGELKRVKKMIEIAQNYPMNIQFIYKGRVKNSDILDYYKNNPVDLFVNVSISEGVPVSIMEALSFGIPVIATNSGGVAELIDERCGRLLPIEIDEHFLAREISEFYKKDFKDQVLRSGARNSWVGKANSKINYMEFCTLLKNIGEL